MVKEYPFVIRAGPWILALAAATLVLFLMMPVAVAAEQQRIIVGNTSLCSASNVDGNVEDDDGCLTMARAQPQLEGFEMASDLGSAVLRQSLNVGGVTQGTKIQSKAACGRVDRNGRYIPCTTDPSKVDQLKCDTLNRECQR